MRRPSWHRHLALGLVCALITGALVMTSPRASADPETPSTVDAAIADAKVLGEGLVTAYRKGDATLLLLPANAYERLFVWSAETVSVPTGVVDFLPLGSVIIQLERHEKSIYVLDLSATFGKRASGQQDPEPGQEEGHRIDPMSIAVRRANEPPVAAVLPIVAQEDDGRVLVDVTKLFSDDVNIMSARTQVVGAGLVPIALNPLASYITSVRVFPDRFGVRSLLTFTASPQPGNPTAAPRNVTLRVGHSIRMLAEKPMRSRAFDPRVGFFQAGTGTSDMGRYTEYGGEEGRVESTSSHIVRFRLEKKDPSAEVSDPVQPIVFYIGREVPDRWRPWLKQGVELWQPAFEAAGFSNAIVARDAPSFEDDPSWTPEDVHHSVIRWLAQPRANARGPHVVDPRSGEILASHVEVWPQVIQIFSRYYFAVMSSLDERANTLPLRQDLQGEILRYVVAHEVGHAIGLRHNHIASTAYTVEQMRDAALANKWGANSSIMAYGRFNQAAQPGDGITKFIPGIGPYDMHAIRWGYADMGADPAVEKQRLDALCESAASDRRLWWAAGELPDEMGYWVMDPRVVKENTGAERIEATRLGVANILRSLRGLSAATEGDDAEYAAAFLQVQNTHLGFLKSVARLVGGVEASPFAQTGPRAQAVDPARQRAAVQYLLGDGAESLDAYTAPELTRRFSPFGATPATRDAIASLVDEVLDATKIAVLANQHEVDASSYSVADLLQDTHDALFADLTNAPGWRRALQRSFLDRVAALLGKRSNAAARTSAAEQTAAGGLPAALAALAAASVDTTVFPGWVRETLPGLADRLDEAAGKAADAGDRLHFKALAAQARRVAQMP